MKKKQTLFKTIIIEFGIPFVFVLLSVIIIIFALYIGGTML